MEDEKDTKIENIDGITGVITNKGLRINFLNIYEALEEKNPRNVFLNGQLYIEDRVDVILSGYFGYDNSIRYSSILKFLKSEHCDFFSKIKFLSMLVNTYKEDNQGGKEEVPFIENKEIISSLRTIGEVRNSFQHNLIFEEAFINAIKDGKTFKLTNKRLDTCKSIQDLVDIFKEEVILLVDKLDKITIKEFATHKIDIETLKKILTSPEINKPMKNKEISIYVPEENDINEDGTIQIREHRIKEFGRIWKFNLNDKDTFPSQPHGHDYGNGDKLNVFTGEIYNKNGSLIDKLKEKQLKLLKDKLKNTHHAID